MASDAPEQVEQPPAAPNGATETTPTSAPDVLATVPPALEARMPTRKDTSLREFLNKMDDYAPIVRNPIVLHRRV